MDPVRPDDFCDLAFVDDPDVDPTGDRIAYIRRTAEDEENYESTVHLANLATGETRQLTVTKGNDASPQFGPDGEQLAFVSDRLTDEDRPQLWLLPLDGGEAQQVTSVVGGVSSVQWAPNGESICFTQAVTETDQEEDRDRAVPEDYEPETPDPRVIDRTIYRAHERYFDGRREQLYLLDVADNEVRRLTEQIDRDHQQPVFGDNETLFFTRKAGPDPDDSLETDIVRLDLETGEEETLRTVNGFVAGLDAADADTLAFTHSPTPRPTLAQADLVYYDVSSDDVTVLTDDLDRAAFGQVRFDDSGEQLYFVTPDTGGYVIRETTPDGDRYPVLTDEEGAASAFEVSGGRLAFAKSAWDHPGDLFARSLQEDTTERVTEVNEDYLENHAVQAPEECWFEHEDGHDIQGWLLTPPGEAVGDDGYPLVLEIHGGPHSMWTTSGTMWHEFQSLAGAGYAVLWTNPRGSIGYGEDFAAAIKDDWGDVTHEDLMCALEATVKRERIDEDCLFVTGGSFGGYQTAWTIGCTDRFEAAVSQRGVYDIPAFFGTSDAYRLIESEFNATPWSDHEYLYERSPTSLVQGVDTPTLLLHSEEDFRTPIATAEMYYRALRKLDVPTRLVRYPREGHELSRSGEPGHRIDRIERIVRWFDGYAPHADVPPALERPPNDGLSVAGDDDDSES